MKLFRVVHYYAAACIIDPLPAAAVGPGDQSTDEIQKQKEIKKAKEIPKFTDKQKIMTALWKSVDVGEIDTVKIHLQENWLVHQVQRPAIDDYGNSLLQNALFVNPDIKNTPQAESKLQIAHLLMEQYGMDARRKNFRGESAIEMSVDFGHFDVVQRFLTIDKTLIDVVDDHENTLLHRALSVNKKGHIRRGAKSDHYHCNFNSSEEWATNKLKIANLLVETYGMDLLRKNKSDLTAMEMSLRGPEDICWGESTFDECLKKRARNAMRAALGGGALLLACKYGASDIALKWLNYYQPNWSTQTAFEFASDYLNNEYFVKSCKVC